MDAFYASVEQRDQPELRGRPVAVGGARERGVVAAASYEARQFGVRSAMPSATALRKCPALVFVPPRFAVYKEVSRQIRTIFAEYTAMIEPVALDEAYLDVTDNLLQIASATQIAREIRSKILVETGLTASAGISYNKFLAKLASDYRKPNGQFVVRPAQGLAFVEGLAVGQFHGVGPVTAARMNQLGIFTGADLREQTAEFLQQQFGKVGRYYFAIARAEDHRPVVADRQRKSVGSETTFVHDLSLLADLVAAVRRLVTEVWEYCQRVGIRGRTVTLKVKFADFRQITRSRSSMGPMPSQAVLVRLCQELVEGLFPLDLSVRLLGVTLSNLTADELTKGQQLALIL